jgi:formylglycine-generating enzyme required for sulfatase activity
VSRIFLSHSSANNAEAVALHDWLKGEGWDDIFLDTDAERGIAAGQRWERALNQAAHRCEAVVFLVSQAWLNSGWCLKEFNLAQRLHKRLFGVLIEDGIPFADLPANLTSTWQMVQLATGQDHVMLRVTVPVTGEEAHVTFSAEGLKRLKRGLEEAGLDPKYFAWPPNHDPNRPPYRGLLPLEAEDAGIFFGRDAPIVEALDSLRALRESAAPRLLVILGASGSGKSSFLRAGLLPRLQRDDRDFLPLRVVRPQHAPISGETGLLAALEAAFASVGITIARAELRAAILDGAAKLRPLLGTLTEKAAPKALEPVGNLNPPAIIISIDQAEELFLAEAKDESQPLLALLFDLLNDDDTAIIVIFTIRSDNYERLQLAKELEGLHQETLSLPPMPKGSYAEVIKGPARRLEGTRRALAIEDALVDALLADIEAGGAKDNLPLLAFTLERLFLEYGGRGRLTLADYEALGRIKGSIEAAVERALKAADIDPTIPKDRGRRLALLRRGLIPWLAGIDPDTGAPRRRVAPLSEIPAETRPLIRQLVEQRLLATDVNRDSQATVEPAHEALLRQWSLLNGWLAEDAALLAVLEGVKRASRDWAANNRSQAWLAHQADRLAAAERLSVRPDLAANLEPKDREYIAACRKAEADAKRGRRLLQIATYASLILIIIGLVGWIKQNDIADAWRWWIVTRPYMVSQVLPHVLTAVQEQALKPGESFKECAQDCPEMIVVPAGSFTMGSPETENGRDKDEGPQHRVTIAKPFAVSQFDVTFAEWDACAAHGDCDPHIDDGGWGRGPRPVISVTLHDANHYAAWLSLMTGRNYRLLSEAEWEWVARAGTKTAYYWGDDVGKGNANCKGCGSQWDGQQTSPVGSLPANPFNLDDMAGNVAQWVQDCYHDDYSGAPTDGSAWASGNCSFWVIRGGSFIDKPELVRSAARPAVTSTNRGLGVGFRVARTLP